MKEENLQKLAAAEAEVLARHYGVKTEIPAEETKLQWYRVRRSWENPASQTGAYRVYENAVAGCPEGYAVYNNEGEELYRSRIEYVVQAGDTLGKIAKRYGTDVSRIVKANQVKYPEMTADFIHVGWKLEIL
ncbi:MAG: LysM peptidoglycan-binding domain-containing protein [Lachnospiraceae bacterium]|nr:LysM peptidoglycan-binding domain-containing protein [Lachnospiraceae bacterium]